MKVFLKFIFKSMMERKARFLLLVFAISMSSALFIGSMGAVRAGIDSFVMPITESLEGQDILIESENNALIDISNINQEGINDLRGYIHFLGLNQTDNLENVSFYGMGQDWIASKNWVEGSKTSALKDNEALISHRTMTEHDIKIGDTLKILLAGNIEEFVIKGIIDVEGIFYSDAKDQFALVVSLSYAQEIFGMDNLVNSATAKSSLDTIEESISLFNESNESFQSQKLIDLEAVEESLAQMTAIFYAMLIIVILMSCLIIYGSFKLIITERLPVIGTFFSQGATKSDIRKILYLESIIYGIFGGLLGCAIGTGILYIINYVMSPLREYGIIGDFSLNWSYLISGMVFSVVLSLVASSIPVLKTRKLEVKNIILNIDPDRKTKKKTGIIIGIILMVFVVVSVVLNLNFVTQSSSILIILSLISLILIYPWLLAALTPLFFKGSKKYNGVVALGLHNVESIKSLRGNITLLVLSIISIIIIHSISMSLQDVVVDAFSDMNYDYSVEQIRIQDEKSMEQLHIDLRNNPYIKGDSIHEFILNFGKIENINSLIMGVDPNKYRDYNPYLEFDKGENKSVYDEFLANPEGKVIVSKNIATVSGVEKGQIVTLEINGRNLEYEVVGIVDGKLYYNGSFIMIDNQELKDKFYFSLVSGIFFHTTQSGVYVQDSIREITKAYGARVISVEEAMDNNLKGNQQLMNIISIFSFIAVIIGALGALNNIIISFIQRKRDLAILSSIGMSSGQRSKMIMSESIMTVLWSLILISPYGYLLAKLVTNFTTSIGLPIPVEFDLVSVLPFYLATTILFAVATIPVVFKNKKLCVIREIQYE